MFVLSISSIFQQFLFSASLSFLSPSPSFSCPSFPSVSFLVDVAPIYHNFSFAFQGLLGLGRPSPNKNSVTSHLFTRFTFLRSDANESQRTRVKLTLKEMSLTPLDLIHTYTHHATSFDEWIGVYITSRIYNTTDPILVIYWSGLFPDTVWRNQYSSDSPQTKDFPGKLLFTFFFLYWSEIKETGLSQKTL